MRKFEMKTELLFFFACLIAAALCMPDQSFARPASKRLHELRQPDGSSFSARQWGDEHYHGWETLDGYTIIFDEALKSWTYAASGSDGCLISSSLPAGKGAPQGIQKHLRATGERKKIIQEKKLRDKNARVPARVAGTGKLPVILMNFNDTSSAYPASDFESLMFATGSYSLNDYYREVSYGKFDIGGQVAGWYTASRGHDYYGSNGVGDETDLKAEDLVKEAIAAADADVDFSKYDSDGDCIVDVVIVVHQGPDESATGEPTDIWSHQGALEDYATADSCPKGGKMKIRDYTMQNESDEADDEDAGGIATVGVFAHEYGHALGLPDLYDTDESSMGLGEWSLMAEGTDGMLTREGDRPTHLDPWSKLSLGWIQPQIVSGTLETLSIAPATSAIPGMYQLLSGSPSSGGEYFLIENRQKEKFDVGLPGSGLLIWHIDDSVNPGDNTDNDKECYPDGPACASQHYRVALVQADNSWDLEKGNNSGDEGDPFPGSTENTSFDANSSPASDLYSGSPGSLSVTGIQISGTALIATLSASGASSTTTTVTDGVPGKGCPLESSLDREDDLTALRMFRDYRLRTASGLSAAAAYYRHASEVSAMLARDPVLKNELRGLADMNMAMVKELAAGRSATFSKAGLEDVVRFLKSVKSRGSAQLKNDMGAILRAIADGTLLKNAGISVR